MMIKKSLNLIILSVLISSSSLAQAGWFYTSKKSDEQSTAIQKDSDTLTLDDILSKNITKIEKTKELSNEQKARLEQLKRVAIEYGINVGRAEQSALYNKKLDMMAAQLDRNFDFHRVLINQVPPILPPVISVGWDNFNTIDRKTMQTSTISQKIEVPAQIVSVVPTWRDYLKNHFTVDNHPRPEFIPKNKIENQVWDEAVKHGYQLGKKTADLEWENAWGELKRDYEGMLNYKKALANGRIQAALVELINNGNVVDENGNVLRENDVTIKIVKDATFNQSKVDKNTVLNPNPAEFKLPDGKTLR